MFGHKNSATICLMVLNQMTITKQIKYDYLSVEYTQERMLMKAVCCPFY